MKQNKRKKRKQESAQHKALFDNALPFGHKVERDRTKYTRKKKHKSEID